NLYALTPNKPYAQSRVEDDMLCHRQDDMGYNRLKFYMRCKMPIMHLLACHSTRHGFLPPSFRECVLIRGSTIADDSFGCTEPGEQRFQKFNNHSSVICGERLGFNPFRQIVDSNEDVFVTFGTGERTHEVDAPYVKDFANLNEILWHLISLRNFSLALT
nr:hypothetical protein [Tanacetum cinerariifolium]